MEVLLLADKWQATAVAFKKRYVDNFYVAGGITMLPFAFYLAQGGKNVGGGRSHGGGSGGFGAPAPLGSLPPFTPSFSFATGLNLPNKFHLEVDHQFCGRCCSDCTPFSRVSDVVVVFVTLL